MHAVTFRRVHETTVVAEMQYYLLLWAHAYMGECVRACVCACVRERERKTAILCHLRPLWFHQNFRHYLIKVTIFGKKITEYKMCVLIFSKTFI